jgi:quercetin dioxygenase-like cupin family protein
MIPFQTTNWETVPSIEHKGETGVAVWKTIQSDATRLRLVDFSPNYKADHWCEKGHIIYCLDGDFILHLKDGSKHVMTKGMSCQILDDIKNPHLMTSDFGCKLFIVDGGFLA